VPKEEESHSPFSMPLDLATIIALGNKLAPAAAIYGRLGVLLEDAGTEQAEIVALIRLDPALTLHVVRLSNSVLFGSRERTDTLDGAVGLVGFREIFRLVGLAASHQVFQRDLAHYQLSATRLWENAVATAAAAEVLAHPSGGDTGLAYSGGLMRTLGRVILDGAAAGRTYPGEIEWPLVDTWERQTFGITAAEVAATLLYHWRFPSDLVEAIRGHLDPFASPSSNFGACVLNLASGVVARFGLDLPGETLHWHCNPAKMTMVGVTEKTMEECAIRAREHYTALCAAVEK
jgi:HD-like signal output (HDOD) protein